MAGRSEGEDDARDERRRAGRKVIGTRDTWLLILRAYWASLPYLLIVIGGLLLATWILTEIVF